jgi:hypothetical protein
VTEGEGMGEGGRGRQDHSLHFISVEERTDMLPDVATKGDRPMFLLQSGSGAAKRLAVEGCIETAG